MVSIALQTKDTPIREALSAARMAKSFITRQREESALDRYYSLCVSESEPKYLHYHVIGDPQNVLMSKVNHIASVLQKNTFEDNTLKFKISLVWK